jgi:Rhodopirellula transposase DDE domain
MGSRSASQKETSSLRYPDGRCRGVDVVVRVTGSADALADALQMWWQQVRAGFGHIKRLVVYLDNGPKNSGRRTQFLKPMVQFADWSGLELRLVYYPPYHTKYNPIERCWSALEKKWNGVILNCLKVVLQCALRMTWRGQHPTVKRLHGEYPDGVRVPAKEMKTGRSTIGTIGRSTALRHQNQTASHSAAGKLIPAARLISHSRSLAHPGLTLDNSSTCVQAQAIGARHS